MRGFAPADGYKYRMSLHWPAVVERAAAVARSYPHKITLRQLFYVLASAGVIPNTASAYRHLSSHLARARRAGEFPDLVDYQRSVHVPPSWQDATEFLDEVPELFRLDRTRGQETALYLAAEKDTLRVMFTEWVRDFGIPVLICRGFGSQSYVDIVRARASADPRPAHLLVVGDFDASGEDIQRDWLARTSCWAWTERVCLTFDQVNAYGLVPTEGKRKDPRWPAFAERYGFAVENPVQWEVEALDPVELRRLVMAAVEPYVDRAALALVLAEEQRQAEAMAAFLATWSPPPTA